MADVMDFQLGGYRFIKGAFMYSAGVAALPGFRIERVRFSNLMTVDEGFRRAAAIMENAGRPKTAFAACELRSPEPFTETGFVEFNKVYVETLKEPSFHAFSYAVADGQAKPSFVIAGSGEAEEGRGEAYCRNFASHARRNNSLLTAKHCSAAVVSS